MLHPPLFPGKVYRARYYLCVVIMLTFVQITDTCTYLERYTLSYDFVRVPRTTRNCVHAVTSLAYTYLLIFNVIFFRMKSPGKDYYSTRIAYVVAISIIYQGL